MAEAPHCAQPFFRTRLPRSSAICTALSAAPLRRLSRHAPHVQAVVERRVLPDAADEGGVFADAFDGRDVAAGFPLVDHHDARGFRAGCRGASSSSRNSSNSMLIASEWPTNTGTRTQVAVTLIDGIEDLLRLDHHLPLFLGRPVFHEDVDLRNDVEGDLLLELLRRHLGRRVVDGLGLVPELVHPFLPGARDGLVGGDDDALDPRPVVQRLQRHHHLRGRAVGVRDDHLVAVALDRLGVHFRHDQRDLAGRSGRATSCRSRRSPHSPRAGRRSSSPPTRWRTARCPSR